ncbi:hypothetical protein IT398_01220 [Candidatus Nomurabacteria bacterium]|nr:hypothetical protein [Candidatus Nomurabacteria bacterium]
MKNFLKIFIVISFIFLAGHASAIDIRGFDTPVGPENLVDYSDTALRASLSPNQNAEDRGAILSELAVRNDFNEGRINSSQASERRQQYTDAFFHRNGAVFNTGNLDTTTGLPPGNSGNTGSGNPQNGGLAGGEEPLPDCGWNTGCIILRAVAWLLWWVVRLFALLVILANQIFNLAIDISVREFNTYAGLDGVKTAWSIFRDLVNISFIFVLLYVAIGTILQLNSVQGKHLLKNVIIAALLVNFSFFFTGIIIDASNVVANQFYSMAGGENPTGVNGAPDITTSLIDGMRKSYYEDVLAWNGNDSDSTLRQFGSILTSYAGRIVLMLITATVLFAGAVMFFIRTIVLIFVLVLSPVAFLGFAIGGDGLGKLAKKWQSALTNQVIFAPVYLLLILMTIKLVNSGDLGAAANSGPVGSLVVFAIVNGLMLGSLIIAKELGVAGAALGTKLGGGITGFGAKLLGRPIGGIIGSGYKAMGKRVAPDGGILKRGEEGFKRLTLQAKKIPGVKEFTETLSEGRVVKRAVESVTKEPGRLLNEGVSSATGIKILGQTKDDEREAAKYAKEEKERANERKDKEKGVELEQIANDTPVETTTKPLTEAEKKTQEKHEIAVQEVSNKNIVKIDPDTLVKLAHLLSESQMTALSDGKDGIEPKKFAKIKEKREELLRESIKENRSTIIEREIDKMSNKTLAKFIAELNEKDQEQYEKTIQAIANNIDSRILGELSKVGGAKRTRLAQIARRMSDQETVPGAGGGRNPTNLPPEENPNPGRIIIP